jgi:hypothetical protein
MSTATLNFHNVTSAAARVQSVNDTKRLGLTFTDDEGATLDIAIFSKEPEKLLEAIAAVSRPEQAKEAELLAALQGLMELEKRGRVMPIGREWDAARAAVSRSLEVAAALAASQEETEQPKGGA